MATEENAPVVKKALAEKGGRLLSLDALRGFDMFFIMGGSQLMMALCAAFGASGGAFARQFRHSAWTGFTFQDLIFPLFLFIAGVSFPFSTAKRLSQGATRARLVVHVLRRGLTLILLGLVYYGLLKFDFERLRFFGVLQLIGFAWMVAAFAYVFLGCKARAALAVATCWLLLYLLYRKGVFLKV
jgi:predicted acyltransferase